MVLLRNYNTNAEKSDKLKKSLQSLALEIKNGERFKRPSDDESNVAAFEAPPTTILINEETEQKLQTKQKREEQARMNLSKITDVKNANQIINQLNKKNPLYIKFLNIIFPTLERQIKKNYTNVTVPFFINLAITEIEKAYASELTELEREEEELNEAALEDEIVRGLNPNIEEENEIVDEPELLDAEGEEKQEGDEKEEELDEDEEYKKYFQQGNRYIMELIDLEFKNNEEGPANDQIITTVRNMLDTWINSLKIRDTTKTKLFIELPDPEKIENMIGDYEHTAFQQFSSKYGKTRYKRPRKDVSDRPQKSYEDRYQDLQDMLDALPAGSKLRRKAVENMMRDMRAARREKQKKPEIQPDFELGDLSGMFELQIAYRPVSTYDSPSQTGFRKVLKSTGIIIFYNNNVQIAVVYVRQYESKWFVWNESGKEWLELNKDNLIKATYSDYPNMSYILKEPQIPEIISKCAKYGLNERSGVVKPKLGYGLFKVKTPAYFKTLKYGRGIKTISDEGKVHKTINKWVTFGKFRLCLNKLVDDNMLSVQYQKGHILNNFRNTKISNDFKDVIDDIINDKFNEKLLKNLNQDETYLMEKLLKFSQVMPSYRSNYIDAQNKKDNGRFVLLRGIIESGNDNPELKKELKKILLRFLENGKISKNQFLEILMI